MTQLWKPLRLRVYAIAFGGRGIDGGQGASAQERAIAQNRFRPTLDQAPSPDGTTNLSLVDRACSFRWLSGADMREPFPPLDRQQYRYARFEFTNAVVQGRGNEKWLSDRLVLGDDEQSYAVEYPDERVGSDAESLALALGFPDLAAGDPDIDDPCIIDIHREGDGSILPAPGHVLCVTRYVIQYRYDSSVRHNQ